MRLTRIYFAVIATLAVAIAPFNRAITAAIDAVDRLLDLALGLIPTGNPPLAIAGGVALARNLGGQALDPALRQRMRHEAGVSRLAADRHT